MSVLSRIWRTLRRTSYYVGRDLEGNSFYEYPTSELDGLTGRTKRIVKYQRKGDMFSYVAGGRRLPVQWTAWLSHTRVHPPSIEELQRDVQRQQRVLQNVALLQAQDQAEREQSLQVAAGSHTIDQFVPASVGHPPVAESSAANEGEELQPPKSVEPPPTQHNARSELPKMASEPAYEPESWTPKARRRAA